MIKEKKTEPIDLNNKQRDVWHWYVLVKGELYFLRNVCCIKCIRCAHTLKANSWINVIDIIM